MTAPQQQKLKVTGPVVVTANRLGDGAVVYYTAERQWSTEIEDAIVVTTAAEATELLQAALADDIGAVELVVVVHRSNSKGRRQIEGRPQPADTLTQISRLD